MSQRWRNTTVGDLLRLEYGKPLSDAERIDDGRYPVYGANGVKGRTNRCYFKEPSIIVGRKGSAGELNLSDGAFWPLDVTYFVKLNAGVDLRFAWYLLTRLNLPTLAKGVKPGINRNEVYSIPVGVPDLREQKRIVAILDKAFDGIATTEANAENNLKSAYNAFECFRDGIFDADDQHGSKPLGDIASFRNGVNFTKSSKGKVVRIVGVKDFQNRFAVPTEGLDSVTIDGDVNSDDILQSKDLLTVRSNGNIQLIGRTMVANNCPSNTLHSGFTIRTRLTVDFVSSQYVCHFMRCRGTRRRMVEGGTGTNIKSLNQGTLASLRVPLPPADEQKRIAGRLDEFAQETERLGGVYRQKLLALEGLKKSLLHQAFSGNL